LWYSHNIIQNSFIIFSGGLGTDYALLFFFISQEKHCHTVDSVTECEGNTGKDKYGIGQGEKEGRLQAERVALSDQKEQTLY